MKLHNWVIQSALAAGDHLAAVNAVAEIFKLPLFTPESAAFTNRVIHRTTNGLSWAQEIRISSNGKTYTWSPNTAKCRTSIVMKNTWIVMWLLPINR